MWRWLFVLVGGVYYKSERCRTWLHCCVFTGGDNGVWLRWVINGLVWWVFRMHGWQWISNSSVESISIMLWTFIVVKEGVHLNLKSVLCGWNLFWDFIKDKGMWFSCWRNWLFCILGSLYSQICKNRFVDVFFFCKTRSSHQDIRQHYKWSRHACRFFFQKAKLAWWRPVLV